MRWKFGTPLTLATKNYSIRSLDPDHIPDVMIQWFADAETMRYMNDPMNLDHTQLVKLFSTYTNRNRIALVIHDKKSDQAVGIFRIYLDLNNEIAYTSILIGDKDYWGRGIVLEVRDRIIQFLFTAIKVEKICGNVRARNLPALFNYSRQLFVKEGIQKRQIRNHEGGFDDVVQFALFRDEWMKLKNPEPLTSHKNNEA